MKLAKILKIALNMVKANKLRSWLTIIGIIIGIASVVAIVTTGEYFQEQVTETLEELGGDVITIYPSTPFLVSSEEDEEYEEDTGEEDSTTSGDTEKDSENDTSASMLFESETEPELTVRDILTLRRIRAIEYINVNVDSGAELKFGGESTNIWVRGVDPNVWPEITKKKVGEGRMLAPGDRAVVILSNELAKDTFEREIRLNQMVLLNGRSYRVVGILAKDGGLLGSMGSFGASVYMPYQEVYSLYSDEEMPERERDVYGSIEIKVHKEADYDSALEEMKSKLRLSRKVTEDTQDFYVYSPKENIENVQKLINGLTAFLAFIAGISLLVGSTGIANTMFTSVLEKTKEIGIMKAIGAKNSDIMLIFLCNAAMIGLVGGIIGILLGTAAVQAILFLISIKMNAPFEFALSLKGTLIATLVSIIVGLIAGLVPAKNASELKPVDALRYE
ncbi:ABC transporter, permease protein [Methanosarcina siciliae C2J]|uniref:ABC transporter, permease protein n=1 Tax=Methanosarcina siciliae C2J TaxID=1434118 RepID=A0A0E3PT23_9EURY|nr:ABC transporter permease [Methanosarcina siciliae]AKB38613.1 ABC transporter, permease protein [Methanosarcina siciliae C2J]